MKYRDQILEFIHDETDNETAFFDWIESMPLLEQPDILREFKEIVKEMADNQADDVDLAIPDFEAFTEFIDNYEDKILDEKLAEANLEMAQQQLDKRVLEIIELTAGVRRYVIDCIVNKEDNAEAMKELAQKLIDGEKENDVYDPENWSDVAHLLE